MEQEHFQQDSTSVAKRHAWAHSLVLMALAANLVACATAHTPEVDSPDGGAQTNIRPGDVGASCRNTPSLHARNWSSSWHPDEVYAISGESSCHDTDLCLVYRIPGNPSVDCDWDDDGDYRTRCASEEEVSERVFCSCRCDGEPGINSWGEPSVELCDCPSGFRCSPTFDVGPVGFVGSYCVPEHLE